MKRIFFSIDGKPIPQARHRPKKPPNIVMGLIAQAMGKGVRLVNASNYDPSYQDKHDFNLQSRRYAPPEPISGPVLLYLVFYMPVPKGALKSMKSLCTLYDTQIDYPPSLHSRDVVDSIRDFNELADQRLFHIKRPDIDNYLKFLMDALNGLMWVDDSQVQIGGAFKICSHNPRTEVEIYYE